MRIIWQQEVSMEAGPAISAPIIVTATTQHNEDQSVCDGDEQWVGYCEDGEQQS